MKNKKHKISPAVMASLCFIICSVFQKGISFITVPIFTRILSAEEYGIYSLFLSWESLLTVFVTLNLSYQVFNNGMVKYKTEKDAYTTSMVGLTIVSTLVYFLIYLVFNKIWFNLTDLSIKFFIYF